MEIVFRPEGIKSYTTFRNGKKYDLKAWEEPPTGTPDDVIAEAKRNGLQMGNGAKAQPKDLDDLMDTAPAGFAVGISGRKSGAERFRERREARMLSGTSKKDETGEKPEAPADDAAKEPVAGSDAGDKVLIPYTTAETAGDAKEQKELADRQESPPERKPKNKPKKGRS